MNPIFKKSATYKNLEAAFAGESMANRKYTYFAQVARDLGNEDVAKLFEETARHETAHAISHLEFLYPRKDLTIEKILELSIQGERYEHTEMYPGFENTAEVEGFSDAVREFREQAQESIEHEDGFKTKLKGVKKLFAALAKVERGHADGYQKALNKVHEMPVESCSIGATAESKKRS